MCKVSYQSCLHHRRLCSALCYANFYSEDNNYAVIYTQLFQLDHPTHPWRLLLLILFPPLLLITTSFYDTQGIFLLYYYDTLPHIASTMFHTPFFPTNAILHVQFSTARDLGLHSKQYHNTCYFLSLDLPPTQS